MAEHAFPDDTLLLFKCYSLRFYGFSKHTKPITGYGFISNNDCASDSDTEFAKL